MLGTGGACGRIGLPGTASSGVAAVSRVLGRNKAGTLTLEPVHLVGDDGHGDGFVSLVVGVLVVVGKVDRRPNDETTGQIVGRGVEDGVGCGGRPNEHVIVGLPTGQRVGGEIKGFHHEADGVNDVHGNGGSITDTRGPETLDGHRDFDVLVHEDVIHHRPVGLNPLRGRHGSVAQRDGFDREVVVGAAAPGSGLSGNDHVHGEGLHQEQHDNGEGHHSAHGHQHPWRTRWSIRRSPFDGRGDRIGNHRSSSGCRPNPRITGSS